MWALGSELSPPPRALTVNVHLPPDGGLLRESWTLQPGYRQSQHTQQGVMFVEQKQEKQTKSRFLLLPGASLVHRPEGAYTDITCCRGLPGQPGHAVISARGRLGSIGPKR